MVCRRRVHLLSPIECSIDDIGTRILTMREEVQAGIDRACDTRGLTRLVQGSVLPQVGHASSFSMGFLLLGRPSSFQVFSFLCFCFHTPFFQ